MIDMLKLKTDPAVDLLPFRLMTPSERRAGRFLRAPDHDAGTGSDAGDVGGDADGAGAEDAGVEDSDTSVTEGADDVQTGDDDAGGDAADDDDDGTALGGKSKADEGKGEGDEAPVVPEAYELTAPEGMTLDAEMVTEATPIFKELKLSNEGAQKLMPVAAKLAERAHAAGSEATFQQLLEAGSAQRKGWLDSAKADKEIGGANWDASLAASARALDALGFKEGSDFRKALNETGFGNHPDMIRAFAKVGAMVGEDGDFVRSDAGASVKVPAEDRWYGDKKD